MSKAEYGRTEHGSNHHLIPSSRIPQKIRDIRRQWNLIKKSVTEHRAWHFLFYNRLPCEAIKMILDGRVKKSYGAEQKDLDKKTRRKIKLREKSWRIVFGDVETARAVEIITKYWAPEGCFEFEECNDCSNPDKFCPLLKINRGKRNF